MAVACGYDFSVAVTEDGDLFSFGGNKYGELGTGELPGRAAIAGNIVPTRVSGLPAPVRQVAAGRSHTGIVTDAGDLFMCGRGNQGQLGLDVLCNNRNAPTLVDRSFLNNKKVLMVAAGDAHTVTLTEGGVVYTWGDGSLGQLGHGNENEQETPEQVPAASFTPDGSPDGAGERIVMVAAGGGHTVALNEAGHLFTWGLGGRGQLGHGDEEDLWAPRQVEAGRFAPEGGGSGQVEKVVFVAAGDAHTVAVTAGGRLYTWGSGYSGQLGHGDNTNQLLVPTLVRAGAFGGSAVVMAACGFEHTLVVTHNGALWACGWGAFGQLGLNDEADRHVFERVGVESFGDARVVTAAAGYFNSAAVTEDGALWTWGKGSLGQLGHGNEQNHLVPVQVPKRFFDSKKIGRCRELPRHYQMAFAMGTHTELGEYSNLNKVTDLIPTIVNFTRSWPKGLTKQHEGLGRLLGAGLISLDKWPDFENIKQAVKTTLRACAKVCRPCTVGALTQNL